MNEYKSPHLQGTEPITTPRLNLRKFKEYDVENFFKWSTDEDVLRYFTVNPPENLSEAHDMIRSWRGQYSQPEFLRWCIAKAETNQAVGEISASIDVVTSAAEVEYALWSRMRGYGYAAEALEGVIGYLHDNVGVHRIMVEINTDNIASTRTAEKAGMELEGIMRDALVDRNGEFYDVAVFSHIAEDTR